MEDLDFYDALSTWTSQFTVRDVVSFDGFLQTVSMFNDGQRSKLTSYLRHIKNESYERYLTTRYWYAVRLKVISDRKHTCEVCSEKRRDVEVHHRNYDHLGEEYAHLTDLRLLCKRCHKTVHAAANEAAKLVQVKDA
jgi:hypothetical protein